MPDHIHLLTKGAPNPADHARFISVLATYARVQKRSIWCRIGPGKEVPDSKHLLRQIRYVHLNPCREKLVSDPLSWEWSTHREAVGAAAPGWIDLPFVRSLLSNRDFEARFHAYVSGDPSVKIEGTSLPVAGTPIASIPRIGRAVLSASRNSSYRSTERRRVVHLARQLGDPKRAALASFLGVTVRTITHLAQTPLLPEDQAVLRAATLLLSDARFLEVHREAQN